MAEIKKTFRDGKMNQDFDDRLVPKEQPRRIVNGRIARSEGSNVGALENVRGNLALSNFVDDAAVIIGSIRQQSENRIFYFIAGSREDGIYEFNEETERIRIILRSTSQSGVLNFRVSNLITGINIIGEGDETLLFWTDNFNPPRRINIERMVTRHRGLRDGVQFETIGTGRSNGSFNQNVDPDDTTTQTLTIPVDNVSTTDIESGRVRVEVNNTVYAARYDRITDTTGSLVFTAVISFDDNELITFLNDSEIILTGFTAEEISVVKRPPNQPPLIDITEVSDIRNLEDQDELERLREENLKEKFVRFAYRWKYIDDEYSVLSPYSEIPFSAGRFSYDRISGQLTCMENLVREVAISMNTGPRDVVEVELIYKSDDNPTPFVVESYIKADEGWRDNIELSTLNVDIDGNSVEQPVTFSSNKLYRALSPEEANATFHNVPLTAQAQEISSNRVIYGNYVDRYDIEDLQKVYSLFPAFDAERGYAIGDRVTFRPPGAAADSPLVTYEAIRAQDTPPEGEVNIAPPDVNNWMVSRVVRQQSNEIMVPITLNINVSLDSNSLNEIITDPDPDEIGEFGVKSLKSDRDYEVGIVYFDAEGRSTPVLTSNNNSVHVPIQNANRTNRLKVSINSKAPWWATHYRFFIKNNRETHYNVIPLEYFSDPFDPEQFVWFRIAQADSRKVAVGDYLLIKVNNNQFFTATYDERTTVRVEDIGAQDTNFLETTTPRVDPDDETSDVLTIQRAGVWMKVRNTDTFVEDIVDEDNNSFASISKARSNNTRRFDDYRPIRGSIADYIDMWHYYPAPDSPDASNDEDDMRFEGTYNPSAGGNDQDGTAVLGGDRSGPMRIEIIFTDPNNTGAATHFNYNYYINPTPAQGGTGNSLGRYIEVRRITTDIPISTSSTNLVNGTSVRFMTTTGWFEGDRLTCVYRRAANFLWTWFDEDEGSDNPNSRGKKSFAGRRANIVMPVNDFHAEDESIYGGSLVQFGVDDGLNQGRGGSPLSGRSITLPFEDNVFTAGPNYYPNIEEWMFEEGLWNPNGVGGSGAKRIFGTNKDGNAIGMSQFGFWRGIPTLPRSGADTTTAALVAAGSAAILAAGGATVAANAIALTLIQVGVSGVALGPVGIAIAATAIVVAALIVIAAALFGRRPGEGDQWRIISSSAMIMYDPVNMAVPGMDNYDPSTAIATPENWAYPLYMIVQSGNYNHSRNKNAKDIRMESSWNYMQGNIGQEQSSNAAQIIFETIPQETNTPDILFFEVGRTYKCENGVHYGDDPNNHQIIETLGPTEVGVEGSEVMTPIEIVLDYSNTIAFNNGIESSVIRDEFGQPSIAQGAKASLTIEDFEQEDNIASLIYSGAFNANTGVNNTNVFSSFDVGNRTIVKDLDTNFGSIQKMYAENRYLYCFQEDKVSRVQINRQTLTNSDGSVNVAANRDFLGEEEPITGEYGISLNPESFAVYGPTKFFSDRSRGVILQLEGDSLSEISNFGMRDFFRDNLEANELVIGSYDDYHDQYLVTMRDAFLNPADAAANIPLLLSRQGFLSRSDACRFPEERLQFTDVYEFYHEDEPPGFQLGDIVFYDVQRTSVFNGDDDWFVWNEVRGDVPMLAATAVASDLTQKINFNTASSTFDLTIGNLREDLMEGQVIEVQSIANPERTYNAVVRELSDAGILIRYDDGTTVDAADQVVGAELDLNVTQKWVINIDNFGVVRRKLNCIGIQPLNHDAFRASLQGYQSAAEACGDGIVGRILYHNGAAATPIEGDYVYDSPYASDEYVDVYTNYLVTFPYDRLDRVVFGNTTYEAIIDVPAGEAPVLDGALNSTYWEVATDENGNRIPTQYKKGRTQRSGWYQIFDGVLFEDYVIQIVNGIVVDRERCETIRLNRTQVMVGDRVPALSTMANLGRDEYSARVCREIPNMRVFHNGSATLPVIGNIMFENDFTTDTLDAGSYSLPGGFYAEVNSEGIVTAIFQCIVRECIRDLVNTYDVSTATTANGIFNQQISTNGQFTFLGIIDEEIYGNTDRQVGASATIRWVARGAERYPANPSDFYEQTFTTNGGALLPNEIVTLTNTDFIRESMGDTNIEYSILEFCYDRNLVPQNIVNRYYGPDRLEVSRPLASASTGGVLSFVTQEQAFEAYNQLTNPDIPVTASTGDGVVNAVDEEGILRQGDTTVNLTAAGNSVTSGWATAPFQITISNVTQAFTMGEIVISTPFVRPGGTYPTADAATSIVRIFDLTGNILTGPVETPEALYYDRTAVVRTYYTSEDLTPLDGSNGTGGPLWWALSDTEGGNATEACLIDSQGRQLECRDASHAFEFELHYDQSNEVTACTTSEVATFLADRGDTTRLTRDFEDATSIRTLQNAIPPAGFYSHLEQDGTTTEDDDQRIVRFWNGTAFEARWPNTGPHRRPDNPDDDGTYDNCPIALPRIRIRFSTDEQTGVCSQGEFVDAYISPNTFTVTTPRIDAFSARTGVNVWRNQFGTDPFPTGWFGPDENGATWNWLPLSNNGEIRLEQQPCITVCDNMCATNNGRNGDCTFDSYCDDRTALNFGENAAGTRLDDACLSVSNARRGLCRYNPTYTRWRCNTSTGSCESFTTTNPNAGHPDAATCQGAGCNVVFRRWFCNTATGNCELRNTNNQNDGHASFNACNNAGCEMLVTRYRCVGGNCMPFQTTNPNEGFVSSNCNNTCVATFQRFRCVGGTCTEFTTTDRNEGFPNNSCGTGCITFTEHSVQQGTSAANACAASASPIFTAPGGNVSSGPLFRNSALTNRYSGFTSNGTGWRQWTNGSPAAGTNAGSCPAPARITSLAFTRPRDRDEFARNEEFVVDLTWTVEGDFPNGFTLILDGGRSITGGGQTIQTTSRTGFRELLQISRSANPGGTFTLEASLSARGVAGVAARSTTVTVTVADAEAGLPGFGGIAT